MTSAVGRELVIQRGPQTGVIKCGCQKSLFRRQSRNVTAHGRTGNLKRARVGWRSSPMAKISRQSSIAAL